MRQNENSKNLRNLQFIAICFVICPIFYVGLLWFLRQQNQPLAENLDMVPMLTGILAAAFSGQVAFAYMFPRIRRASQADQDSFSFYKNNMTVQLGLLESGAVYGLMLGFMGAELTVPMAFSAASVFFILTIFPTEEKLRKVGGEF